MVPNAVSGLAECLDTCWKRSSWPTAAGVVSKLDVDLRERAVYTVAVIGLSLFEGSFFIVAGAQESRHLCMMQFLPITELAFDLFTDLNWQFLALCTSIQQHVLPSQLQYQEEEQL